MIREIWTCDFLNTRADRHRKTDRHTDTLIAVLCLLITGGKVIMTVFVKMTKNLFATGMKILRSY